jgi:hypothetical protein
MPVFSFSLQEIHNSIFMSRDVGKRSIWACRVFKDPDSSCSELPSPIEIEKNRRLEALHNELKVRWVKVSGCECETDRDRCERGVVTLATLPLYICMYVHMYITSYLTHSDWNLSSTKSGFFLQICMNFLQSEMILFLNPNFLMNSRPLTAICYL